MKTPALTSSRSMSGVGIRCGNGQPMKYASAAGTPATSTASARNAPHALSRSPNVRRVRTETGVRERARDLDPPGAGAGVELRRAMSCAPRVRSADVEERAVARTGHPVTDSAVAVPWTVSGAL